MKCIKCEAEYGREEVKMPREKCKKCKQPLELVEFWSDKEIIADLDFAFSQQNPIVLVAEDTDGLTGFTWGYKLPLEKFPFLEGKINEQAVYMDEIAVRGNRRKEGIGTKLGLAFLETAEKLGMLESVLRTDERNEASIALNKKLGFREIGIYDPKYTRRTYMKVDLRK